LKVTVVANKCVSPSHGCIACGKLRKSARQKYSTVSDFTFKATVLGYPANRWAVDSSGKRWNKWRFSADG
jgi:hypothetical protein